MSRAWTIASRYSVLSVVWSHLLRAASQACVSMSSGFLCEDDRQGRSLVGDERKAGGGVRVVDEHLLVLRSAFEDVVHPARDDWYQLRPPKYMR